MRIPRYASLAAIAITLALGAIVSVPESESCQCVMPMGPEQAYAASQTVFVGTVTHRVVVDDVAVTQFAVASMYTDMIVFDGSDVTMTVTNEAGYCGLHMAVGSRYFVYAGIDEATGLWWQRPCSGTRLLESAQADLLEHGTGTPFTTSPGPAEMSGGTYVAIARLAGRGMAIPATSYPTIARDGAQVVVEFPWPDIERGPDYYAQVTLDAATGEVLQTLGAP